MSSLTASEIDAHLTPELEQFVQSEVAGGRYSSAGEMVCHALTLLRQGEEDYLRLRDEVRERVARLDRGEGLVIENDEELAAYFDDVNARGLQRYQERMSARKSTGERPA